MSANRLEHYRRLLRRIKHSKGNYRGAPRKEILDLVDELRRTGWQLKDICTELGIAKHTVYTWRKALAQRAQPDPAPVFFPVVTPGEDTSASRELKIVSLGGHCLMGLSLDDAILAMRALS